MSASAVQSSLFETADPSWIDDVDGSYRYLLGHRFAEGPTVLWGLLNPSKAVAGKHDPTTRRIEGYSDRWGFGRWLLVNPMAYRETDPDMVADAVRRGIDVVGPRNREVIGHALEEATAVVVGWGADAGRFPAVDEFVTQLRSTKRLLWCIGMTKSSAPMHPVRRPYGSPQLWNPHK